MCLMIAQETQLESNLEDEKTFPIHRWLLNHSNFKATSKVRPQRRTRKNFDRGKVKRRVKTYQKLPTFFLAENMS